MGDGQEAGEFLLPPGLISDAMAEVAFSGLLTQNHFQSPRCGTCSNLRRDAVFSVQQATLSGWWLSLGI